MWSKCLLKCFNTKQIENAVVTGKTKSGISLHTQDHQIMLFNSTLFCCRCVSPTIIHHSCLIRPSSAACQEPLSIAGRGESYKLILGPQGAALWLRLSPGKGHSPGIGLQYLPGTQARVWTTMAVQGSAVWLAVWPTYHKARVSASALALPMVRLDTYIQHCKCMPTSSLLWGNCLPSTNDNDDINHTACMRRCCQIACKINSHEATACACVDAAAFFSCYPLELHFDGLLSIFLCCSARLSVGAIQVSRSICSTTDQNETACG